MKYVLLAISVACLGFTFIKDINLTDENIPQEITSAAPDDNGGVPANKGTSVTDVVNKALAFRALLTTAQQATLQQTYTPALARKWSNLPCGSGCRNGIQISTLTSAQLTAALQVIQAAAGTVTNEGYSEFLQIRGAEAILKAQAGGGYDTGIYFISFLNTPSTTGSWMLQFGGHHYAANIAFNNGHVIGATPRFEGVEPLSYTANGSTYAPLTGEHDAMAAMLASLTAAQLTTAKITTQTFSDVTLAPGETNGGSGTFPATKAGVACSTLTTAQKALVIEAMKHWVQDMDDATAAAIMATYESEIDNTYIAYTGNGTSGTASSFLTANTNYVRIDGPTVWIEFVCQSGVVFTGIHYHTVWRDHSHDYGVDLTGASIDGTATGVATVKSANSLSIYPNPADQKISVSLKTAVKDADVILVSAATGQTITIATHRNGTAFDYEVNRLPAGNYILRIEDATSIYTGKFTKL